MKRVYTYKLVLGTILTSGFVTVSNALKDSHVWIEKIGPVAIAIIGIILGSSLASIVVKVLQRFESIRRLIIFQEAWIEGVWYQTTFNDKGEPGDTAIVEFNFIGQELDLHVNCYHKKGSAGTEKAYSDFAYLHEADKRYFNQFTLWRLNGPQTTGIATGTFTSSGAGGEQFPDEFCGFITFYDNSSPKKLILQKISSANVDKYRKKCGCEWRGKLLEEAKQGNLLE